MTPCFRRPVGAADRLCLLQNVEVRRNAEARPRRPSRRSPPSRLFVSKEREEIVTPANIRGAPDLVVEILSPSSASRDWRDKFELYSKHGVKEYWIVDPSNRVVWLASLRGGALEIAGTYGVGDTVSSTALAGFSVKVADIF